MKLHLVTNGQSTIWVTSQSEAATQRAKFVADGSKRSELTTLSVDVPTDKNGLRDFLNVLASHGADVAVAMTKFIAD